MTAAAASELEFFLYRDSYRAAHDKHYQQLDAAGSLAKDAAGALVRAGTSSDSGTRRSALQSAGEERDASAKAGELESGLQVGESPGAFYVKDVTGPNKGSTLCYR